MEKIDREDISITSKHSNRSKEQIKKLLEQYVYANNEDWRKFINLFLLILGIGFFVSGVIFFFAYNWADLNKFMKIGIVLILLITTVVCGIQLKIKESYKNMLLTAASVIVGVLFAIFGQIYQTGANAYDFFLAWTLFITIWVLAINFYPLWLLYMILFNTTIILFNEQVQNNFDTNALTTLIFLINGITLVALLIYSKRKNNNIPLWFRNTLVLIVTTIATIGMIDIIFYAKFPEGLLLSSGTLGFFIYGIIYALSTKSTFFIATISFSLLILINSLLIKIFENEAVLILVSIVVIIATTAIIKLLLTLQRKWNNDK